MRDIETFFGIAVVAVIVLGLSCSTTPTTAGGTETGDAVATGAVYNPGGTPAANATVRFFPVNYNPRTGELAKTLAVADSTTTDANGSYSVTLDSGTYNILASGNGNLAYQDSIAAIKDSTIHPPTDTLKAPGSLTGIIGLGQGGNVATVVVLVFGTNAYALPDAAGRFTLANMAEGTYMVRLLSTLDNYDPLDVDLTFKASRDSVIADTLWLPFKGIPTPKNVRIQYDTLKQIVTLTWDKADTSLVRSYNVYRTNVDSNTMASTPINASPITDTMYSDSTGTQDQTYVYLIAAVDKNGSEGVKSAGVSVKVVSAFPLVDSISLKTSVTGARDFVIGEDSLIYVAFQNDAFVGVFSPRGDSIRAFGKGMFSQLGSIALDSKEDVYVEDADKNKCTKFSRNGDSLSQWSIYDPTVITIDRQDNIFIGFSNEQGILKFDTAGNRLDSLILPATNKASLLRTDAIGNLFVGDAGTNNIEEYSSTFSLLATASISMGNSKLYILRAIDESANLFLEHDYSANRIGYKDIYVFDSVGSYKARWNPSSYYCAIQILGEKVFVMDGYAKMRIFKWRNLPPL